VPLHDEVRAAAEPRAEPEERKTDTSEPVAAPPKRPDEPVAKPAAATADASAAPAEQPAVAEDGEIDVAAMLGDGIDLGLPGTDGENVLAQDELADAEGEEFESLFGEDEAGLDAAGPDLGAVAEADAPRTPGIRAVPTPQPESEPEDEGAGMFDGLLDDDAEPGRSAGGGQR
jgi:hypothetical protein